jgi:hypothetical protein
VIFFIPFEAGEAEMVETLKPRAFWSGGDERRRYVPAGRKGYEQSVPGETPPERLAQCPGAILDTAPGGGGLGVWLLVEDDGEYCTYEYGGGIA